MVGDRKTNLVEPLRQWANILVNPDAIETIFATLLSILCDNGRHETRSGGAWERLERVI